jgi:HK97 family phage major capsid protein
METPTIIDDIQSGLAEIKSGVTRSQAEVETQNGRLAAIENQGRELRREFDNIRRGVLRAERPATRPGRVTEDCARYLGAVVLCTGDRNGKLSNMTERQKEALMRESRDILGIAQRSSLTSTDIPLPVEYSSEIVELIAEFGAARSYGTVYPLGVATTKLPRLKTTPAFGFIAMSAAVPERSPQTEFVDFNPQKAGGLIRVPAELDADSIANLGQFVARYAAREMARWEDTVFFTADGTGTYNSLKGVSKEVVDQSRHHTMPATKTKITDFTLSDARKLRTKPESPALAQGHYYFHPTLEQLLNTFNTSGDKPYMANGANGATLDGFPIRWVDVLPSYSETADPSRVFGLFGDLSYWYLGVRAGFQLDTSLDVFFATDEIAIRALERFTIGMMATGAMGGVRTAAS